MDIFHDIDTVLEPLLEDREKGSHVSDVGFGGRSPTKDNLAVSFCVCFFTYNNVNTL